MHDPNQELRDVIELRRELHRRAELSNHEQQTPALLTEYLRRHAPDELVRGLGGAGLAAVWTGNEPGATVLVRAELDALPIPEANGSGHASRDPAVSHRCGHDGHMAMVAALAPRLARRRPHRGRVVLLFQPAEETGEGAARVIDDPAFGALAPDWAIALHNLPGHPLGEVLLREGSFAAASSGFVARLEGATSHAAHPEEGRSPAPAVAELITVLARLADGVEPSEGFAVSTVIHARLGEVAFGTSPGSAVVMATLRAARDDVLADLKRRAVSAAEASAAVYHLALETQWREEFPATVNDRRAVEAVARAAALAGLRVREVAEPFRWSEDFGHLTRRCRGVLFGLGSGLEQPPLHAPDYDFPEALLPLGTDLFARIVEDLLGDDGAGEDHLEDGVPQDGLPEGDRPGRPT